MKNLKKIFALAMILAMVLSLAVPAMAADTHTITINKNADGYTYAAYQIFSGVIEATEGGDDVLTEVVWGNGINGDAFLAALLGNDTSNTDATYTTWKNSYANLYKNATDAEGNPIVVDTASEVAAILAENNSTAHAQAFAHLAAQYLSNTASGTSTQKVNNSTDPATISYEIANLLPGYYLVKNTGTVPTNTTATDYILKLVNDISLNPKDGEVTVEKWILDGEDMEVVADYSIGDVVTFELHGTLPDYYESYDEYYYMFNDTMSKGLTLNYIDHDSNPETAAIPDVTVEFDNDASIVTVDRGDYTVDVGTTAEGEPTISVGFADLVALEKENSAKYTINGDTKIYVIYNATLNDDAIIGGTGNPNKVTLKFTNDPNTLGEGTTNEDVVHVFTFTLDVTKTDGESKDALEGVEFKLYRYHGGQKQYAVINLPAAEGAQEDAITDYTVTGWADTEEGGTAIPTDENGNFLVKGLEASVYYLQETKPLSGYNPIEDVQFTIHVSYNETTQQLVSLTINMVGQETENGDMTDGSVDLEVINNPGALLPETGGMGTTLFYVFGGLMVCAAVVLLVTKRRMSV